MMLLCGVILSRLLTSISQRVIQRLMEKLVNYWSYFEHQMVINDRPIIQTDMIQLTDYEKHNTIHIYVSEKKGNKANR